MAKTFKGSVVSSAGNKTIVIRIVSRKTHPLYKKQYSNTVKMMAHDEKNEAQVGDTVLIGETKPLSRRKRFALVKVIARPIIRESETVASITEEPAEKNNQTPKSDTAALKKPTTEKPEKTK